ncbi:MAG: hypothetical protein IJI14_18450 [Anaerolineaceae bacterium]|nr:hypothetical protein [Anaerolineaceae bacterium]
MSNKLTQKLRILSSDVDYETRLSYPDIFAMFQNIAVANSEDLGYDQPKMSPKGLFWVTSKAKVHILERPKQGEYVELSTWPEKPDRIRGRRNYLMTQNGKTIIEGTSEWAVIDRNKNRLYMLDNLYDSSFEFYPAKVLPEPFHRFTSNFSGEPFGEYKVRSVDIDLEGHMNNVNYLRALIGLFSRKELEEMNIHEIECYYKVSCYEGDRLLWYQDRTDSGLEICSRLENGTDIFFAKLN